MGKKSIIIKTTLKNNRMNTKNSMLAAMGLGSMLFVPTACNQVKPKEEAKKPNIIYILADDLGYGDLSCYGQKTFSTPNIDQLAADGLMFSRHYAGCTVCAPSRASLLTGKHTGHTSVRVNLINLVDDKEATTASVLKSAGYSTALIGKWGVGHDCPNDEPKKKGFDFSYGYINMWHAHNYFPDFLVRNGQVEKIEGNVIGEYVAMKTWDEPKPAGVGFSIQKTHYSPDLFQKEALNYLDTHKDSTFFLFVPITLPHANNEADNGLEAPSYGEFANTDWPDNEKGFASMVLKLDSVVGAIRAKVRELGLEENTLIIFSSDNGPHREGGHKVDFFDSNGPLRGNKRDLYEGGIRVPMIAAWKGKIQANTTTDHISAFWDVLPTFCDIANVEVPAESDGISFLPTLLGKTAEQVQHDYLYWEFYEDNGKQAVMKGNYKGVILNLRDQPVFELYDLNNDLSETTNIAAEHPELEQEMRRIFKEAHTDFYVPLYDYSPYYPKGKARAF
jgi:arylsulfatase A-like enzyme